MNRNDGNRGIVIPCESGFRANVGLSWQLYFLRAYPQEYGERRSRTGEMQIAGRIYGSPYVFCRFFFFLLMFIGLSTFLFLLTGQTWNGVCPSIFFCFFFYCLLFPAFPGSFSRVENRDWTEMNSESWVLKQKKKGGGKRPLGAGGWGGVGTGGIFFVYLLRSPRIPLFSFVFLRFFCVFFMVPLRVWNRCRAVGVHSKE